MTRKQGNGSAARAHFTRLSDDCPICRLMEHLDREGLLEPVELDDEDLELELEGAERGTFAFKGPRVESLDRLSLAQAKAVLAAVPAGWEAPWRDGRPANATLVALGERYPGMLFHGYRVDPDGPADQLLLAGFYIPAGSAQPLLAELPFPPTIWEIVKLDGRPYWRAEWL